MVSVVVTVLNEQLTIEFLTQALLTQTHKDFEIIIVDGGSTDGTLEKIPKSKKIRVFSQPGNRSVGRNFGVSKSRGKIIAFTDAGCIPEKNWLKFLTEPFQDSLTQVVSGYYKGLPKGVFEKCLIPYVLVMPDQVGSEFLPATRSMAIRKSYFIQSGGFDERLWHNEDYAFAIKLKTLGVRFHFEPKAVVGWIPRHDLKSAAWMLLRFAIGDAQAAIFRPKVKLLAIRFYLYFFLIFINAWFGLLIVPYLFWAILKNYKYVRNWQAVYWLPILQLTSDIMVLFGTAVGLLSRVK